ncbi:hypothetical protein V8B97DRAFT_454942 [Scleroderma yunnanense]
MDLMDAARYVAMDAQRFDPMHRPSKSHVVLNTWKERMGQVLCKSLHSGMQMDDAVGGIWEDHELVFVPITPQSPTEIFTLADSETSTSNSRSSSTSSYATTSLSSSIGDHTINTTPPSSHHTEVYDCDDLVITRTTIRPAPGTPIAGLFTRSTSPIPSRSSNPLFSSLSSIIKTLSCLSASAFAQDFDGIKARKPEQMAKKPVLQVIVTQTREQYEHDMAFKEAVQEIYPESSGRGRH